MKLKNIIVLAACFGALASCNVTDISPIDSLTDKSYWKTVNDLKLYANGFYGNLSAPAVDKENASDNFVPTNYSQWLFNEVTVASGSGGWSWGNVRNINYFMKRYHTVSGSEADINMYVGEMRFFRALDYYGKIKTFGDVPWYQEDLTTADTEELYKGRDPRDTILTRVIEDLEFAAKWLPEAGMEEKGRLTKDVALQQLARVCLYYGTYKKYHEEPQTGALTSEALLKKAISATDAIMATGKYDIVKGSDQGASQQPFEGYPLYYSNQFTQEDLTGNKEGVLIRYYEPGVLTHETGRRAGESGNGLTKDFAESFLCKDGLPIANSPLYKGDETLEAEFENRDPRMYQIIDNKHRPYRINSGVVYVNPVPSCEATKGVTGYPCVKFRSADPKQEEARNSSYDWFAYRYAEVLLINAEAHAELGTCTQDVLDKTINKLRDRVEMPHMTVNPVADAKPVNYGYDISNLLYEIRRERRIELVAEGFRWDDLIRWNAMKLVENPKTMFGIRITPEVEEEYKQANITFGGENGRSVAEYEGKTYLYQYSDKALNDPGRVWTKNDKRWLSPLPVSQLTLNKNLKQNPGWDK